MFKNLIIYLAVVAAIIVLLVGISTIPQLLVMK